MSPPKIRFIIETVSSAPDVNGNTYHRSCITSTMTGKSIVFEADGRRNAFLTMYHITGDWESLHCISWEEKSIRRFKQSRSSERYEYSITTSELLGLEKVQS